jgi:amidase
MLAAVKPTVGRISRYGVIPITADQDTPGPMAKYVMDVGDHDRRARERSRIRTTRRRKCTPPPGRTTRSCCGRRLKGAASDPRGNYYDPITLPGRDRPRGGLNPSAAKVMEEAIAALKAQGDVSTSTSRASSPRTEGQPAARGSRACSATA